ARCFGNRTVFSTLAVPDWNFIEPFVVHRADFGNCEDRRAVLCHQSVTVTSSHGAVAALRNCLVRFGIRKQIMDGGYKNAHVLRSTVRTGVRNGWRGWRKQCMHTVR